MRTEIPWPPTGYEIGGLMGFSAEYVQYSAVRYVQSVKPLIENLIGDLEEEIDFLKEENRILTEKIASNKLRVKYNHDLKVWIKVGE